MGAPKKRRTCRDCPAYYEPCLWQGGGANPANIVVVSDVPSGFSIGKKTPFYGNKGRLFKQLLNIVRTYNKGAYSSVRTYYTYAALVGAYKPKAAHVKNCRSNLISDILRIQGPGEREPVIVPLGPTAIEALGLKANKTKIEDLVGREMSLTVPASNAEGVRKFKVVPLLSMQHLQKKPGTANVVLSGLLKAVQLGMGEKADLEDFEEIRSRYRIPTTIDGVRELVEEVIEYSEDGVAPGNWMVSLDTETNTLRPYSYDEPKTLMVSFAWGEGKAGTVVLNHPEVQYDPDEAWAEVDKLLKSNKPKSFHNWKYDLKFLEILRNKEVNRVVWDTMLGEHYIDEDKKGHYGLKRLAPIYAPNYSGYDDDLPSIKSLDDLEEAEADEENKVLKDPFARLSELLLTDEELLEVEETPEGRDPELWSRLRSLVQQREKIREVAKKERTEAQTRQFALLKKKIDSMRKMLRVSRPKKKKKEGTNKADYIVTSGFEQLPLETLCPYAAADADLTRKIAVAQLNKLQRSKQVESAKYVMKNQYIPGSKMLSQMEWNGFPVDRELLETYIEKVSERLHRSIGVFHSTFDPSLNPNSPPQVSDLMARMNFEVEPGLDPDSTDKEILQSHLKRYGVNDPRHVFADNLLEYRAMAQTLGTFLLPIRKHSRHDGKIHANFHLNGTSTGRLSSSALNMQNNPHFAGARMKKDEDGNEVTIHPGYNIKNLFCASGSDRCIVNVDVKGAELRVYPVYSEDEMMIDALRKNVDIHSLVTSKVYDIPYEEVVRRKNEGDHEIIVLRTNCKRVIFGTFYGAGPWKIAQQIGCTTEEAEKLLEYIFRAFPALRWYITMVHAQVEKQQSVQTVFGRYRRFRLAHLSRSNMAEARREAVNFLIQSTSSDLVLTQMCEINDHIDELDGKLVGTVHDSFTLDMPVNKLHLLHDFVDYWFTERIREKFSWMPVPFETDIEIGSRYGNTKEVKKDQVEEFVRNYDPKAA